MNIISIYMKKLISMIYLDVKQKETRNDAKRNESGSEIS